MAWLDPAAQSAAADCYRSVYEQVATDHPSFTRLLRVDRFVCPDGPHGCTGELDGVQLRYDGIHFNDDGAARVIPWILERIYAT
ncbi:MAG: hypothetical protein R2705_04265 [Ilumatobacteraceae bacterium]